MSCAYCGEPVYLTCASCDRVQPAEKGLEAKVRELEAQIQRMVQEHAEEIVRVKHEYYRQGCDSYGGVRHPLDMD